MRQNQSWLVRFINRWRKRDLPAEYQAWIIQYGRVTEGRILDTQHSGPETTIYYRYNIANVDYETSQKLSPDQINRAHVYAPGASVTVRFDPKSPGSSIVI